MRLSWLSHGYIFFWYGRIGSELSARPDFVPPRCKVYRGTRPTDAATAVLLAAFETQVVGFAAVGLAFLVGSLQSVAFF